MGLFDALPPPKSNGGASGATPAAAAPAKRPAEGEPSSAADDSIKKARSAASLDLLPSGSSDSSVVQLLPTGQQAGTTAAGAAAVAAEGGQLSWTAVQAAFSEDSGSRLTMEDVAVINLNAVPADTPGCRLAFVGIFDGHGGKNVAQLAGQHLHSSVLQAGLAAEASRVAAAASSAAKASSGGSGTAGGTAQQQQAAAGQPSVKACKAAIAEGFKELDRRALEQCAAAGWPDGCTAVAVWVLGDTVLVANVGDARCVLARQPAETTAGPAAGGQAAGGQQQAAAGAASPAAVAAAAAPPAAAGEQASTGGQQAAEGQPALPLLKAITLTREHKAIFPAERQRIEKAGSFVSGDGRLAGRIEVSRAFGDRAFKKQGMSAVPDVQAFQISRRDAFLLLACDGFWGVFGPQDAVDFAQRELEAKGNSVKQTCNRLIHEAIRERKCKDNCTVLLLRFDHSRQ
ncbi:putative phosphatase 2C 67 [Chlorella sorokiniana]|uniref:protein-serine/threonine phosphatase n=1 Tax=Chlorella sorokiniana TaxID=3076 RepID=A0A2P6TJ89_CHLSO|nr:putative phosphatase 2C 67 [Chlorella sorokiniana]|eukprot:PRW39315.1 putative phosphatase 2C 67 [Chlorella sorokiniana]